jgi:hypothetical protein
MGDHVSCRAKVDGKADQGKALLEPDSLTFRGAKHPKVVVAFVDTRDATAEGDWLFFGPLELELGTKVAAAWAKRIAQPKSVLDKLGVKTGQTAVLLGDVADGFEADLARRGVTSVHRLPRAKPELVFCFGDSPKDLTRLPEIADAGVLWLVREKGKAARITEAQSRAAGRAAGLVDVKVVSFSETHSAEKYVVPLKNRGK